MIRHYVSTLRPGVKLIQIAGHADGRMVDGMATVTEAEGGYLDVAFADLRDGTWEQEREGAPLRYVGA